MVYEGYGPSGVAVIVDALTDNRNRTAPEVRHLLDKYGKGLGATGCVSWSFDRKGVIIIEKEDLDEDTVMMDALDAGADDMQVEEETFEVYTDPDAFGSVLAALEEKGYTFVQAAVEMVPQNYVKLENEDDIKNMENWEGRDRFFLDPGHMSPMLYSTLSLAGYYTTEDLQSLRQWGSVTPGHPEADFARGVENTSGPLGQGHAMALGAAIAERFMAARFGEWMAHKTYAYISDGAVEEEISQGVGRIAGHLGLSNFIMYYDSNNIQLSTKVDEVMTENVAMKYEAWGWNVLSVDGHNINEIREALVAANSETERPTLIIGRTVMGKGAKGPAGESFEDKVSTHGQPLTAAGADFAATVKNLGGDPNDPFAVFSESREAFSERREALRAWASRQAEVEKTWRAEHGDLARKLDMFLSGRLPEIDYKSIEVKAGVATRAASAAVLGVFAETIENMIVASADLSNSDKTDGFLKKTKAFTKGDFSGKFFQAGVSELTMACVANGMALHGGVIPACGTFFVFSDYMKPAVRLSALMRLDRKSTRLNSSHIPLARMPSSA